MLIIVFLFPIDQLSEALFFLHFTCKTIHRNICPQSIIINKLGTWKLCGLEFIERCNESDLMVSVGKFGRSFVPKLKMLI